MKPYLVATADGSNTLYHPTVGENYHSKHGALQESKHVFLQSGLIHYLIQHPVEEVKVLEVGFGTGLNFLLSLEAVKQHGVRLYYTGIEAYPLPLAILQQTGYHHYVSPEIWKDFYTNYENALAEPVTIHPLCELQIAHCKLADFKAEKQFDVLYFDAFAAIHQPEMWTTEALQQVCQYLKPGGVFVTYAITGNLKRSMKSLGFSIEKAPGAPGKREMLRATKISA